MNNYGLFFTFDHTVVRLPINPEEIPVALEGNNALYNVLGIGEVTIQRKPKQKAIEISSYFPGRVAPGVLTPNEFMTPEDYINFFEAALNEKRVLTYTPVRYYENGDPYFTSDAGFRCTIESFEYTERGGETGDFYYTLKVQEYRDYSPMKVLVISEAKEDAPVELAQEIERPVPKSEIVVGSHCVANGTYWSTSYGNGSHGVANGVDVLVQYIVDKSRACPYHITTMGGGALGWISGDCLTVV